MATATVYTTEDLDIDVENAGLSYPTLGTFTVRSTAWTSYVGQAAGAPNYYAWQTFLGFDSSVLGGITPTAAALAIWTEGHYEYGGDWTCEARSLNWGTTVTSADWQSGTAFGNLTLRASLSVSASSPTNNAYTTFTDVSLAAAVNPSGMTYLVLASSRWRTQTTPSMAEYLYMQNSGGGGSYHPPRLTLTYDPTYRKSVGNVPWASVKSVAGVAVAGIKSVGGVA